MTSLEIICCVSDFKLLQGKTASEQFMSETDNKMGNALNSTSTVIYICIFHLT